MSDFLDEPAERPTPRPRVPRRRPRPWLLTLLVLVVVIVGFSLFSSLWTEKLWFSAVGYSSVFTKLVWTRIGLFLIFGLLMALVVAGNIYVAYRTRPLIPPRTPDQAGLDRYREVIVPIRHLLLVLLSIAFGIFAGASAAGHWRTYLLWSHRQPYGKADPYFSKDLGFYIFSLPWLHYLVDFAMTMLVIGVLAAAVVHYLFGGIRLSGAQKFSGAAQVHISLLIGLILLVKAVDYYFDRFDLTTQSGSLITGMTYTRQHAVLPSKNILMAIAVICALVFFANVLRRTWLLPGVGISLFVLSAVLLGMIWPAIVQRFQVDPSVADKERDYISQNIRSTRAAYDIAESADTSYPAKPVASKVKADSDNLQVRLLDPQVVSESFEQLQQVKGYYSVPRVLDVDRYQVQNRERDLVVAARELNLEGLPDGQRNWINDHTVYTHGYGMVAAYGDQRDAADKPESNGGDPIFAERDLPPQGELGKYVGKIYFGEQSPKYSIVGAPKGAKPVELDLPQTKAGSDKGHLSTYDGPGVSVGSRFRKLLYAVKFGDTNILLSSRVNSDSKILYDRSPRTRVQKVAPWLTVDSDALPAVVDGRMVWLVDGYTTSDDYPLSEKRSLRDMVSDALRPESSFATLPNDEINYMRNAVKAVVDAETGKVTLYAWDDSDPLLKAWEEIFPGTVKPKKDIPTDLLAHMRYPEDQFKVQRDILARYHVTDPRTFYSGSDRWNVPQDPNKSDTKQPPYRLSTASKSGAKPVFSLTSVFVPTKRENLAAFVSVGADASDPSTYGKFTILRLPDSNVVPGPSQMANKFVNDDNAASELLKYKQKGSNQLVPGNLLSLPVGEGMLYVEPIYVIRSAGAGTYPQLVLVVASFGQKVGVGTTFQQALDDATGTTPSSTSPPASQGSGENTSPLPSTAVNLLKQADAKFAEAQKLLKSGDLSGYAARVKEAQALVARALDAATAKPTTPAKPSATPSSPSTSG